MKKRLCILPCGAKKIWDVYPEAGATLAKDTYIGTFHNNCQSYANTFFDDWVILSAKYGFLLPNDTVSGNYDVAFDHKSNEIISIEQLKKQIVQKGLVGYDEIIVLGGKKYYKIVEQLFSLPQLKYPLKGYKGIGYMNQALKQSVLNKLELLPF